jgi:hypothetical protein
MNARVALFGVLVCLSPLPAAAQEVQLPVFFLRYDGGVGSEEIEPEEAEEEQMEPSSQRHKVTLRVKEEWSDSLTTNLYTAVSRKEYFLQSGSYLYFYLNPDITWEITDRFRWKLGVRSKWIWYDELDSKGDLKDITSLQARTELVVRLLDRLRLTPFFLGVFDLYRNEAKTRQTYTAGLRLESRLSGAWILRGRYRGILRTPLGETSAVPARYNHEFGLNLSWDPNR